MVNDIHIGNGTPSGYYYGNTEVKRIYFGSKLVHEKSPEFVFTLDKYLADFDAAGNKLQIVRVTSTKNGKNAAFVKVIAPFWANVFINNIIDQNTGEIMTSMNVSCANNTTVSERAGTIIIKQDESGLLLEIGILQLKSTSENIEPSNISFEWLGGERTVHYMPEEAHVQIMNVPFWLHNLPPSNGQVTFQADRNNESYTLFANIEIYVNGNLNNLGASLKSR